MVSNRELESSRVAPDTWGLRSEAHCFGTWMEEHVVSTAVIVGKVLAYGHLCEA